MTCKCGSNRILQLSGKCSDMAYARLGEVEKDGYAPLLTGLGGIDYLRLKICIECHTVQGFTATEDEIIEAIQDM